MSRFFFHLHECGTITRDEAGLERADLAAARDEAVRSARGLMAGEILNGHLCLGCHIEVTDESGRSLLLLPFSEAVQVTGYTT